jgi:hypothetical protein
MNRRDREIALRAIAARATGKPESAAAEILAGIAVLDGKHLPILVWPADMAREEKAAWHRSEAAFWDESEARFVELMSRRQASSSGEPQEVAPSQHQIEQPHTPSQAIQDQEARHAEQSEDLLHSSAARLSGANDASE